jgi:hypothetical protein
MWLITSIGFFSVVQKPGDKQNSTLTVRSRVRSDLAALKQHYLPGFGDPVLDFLLGTSVQGLRRNQRNQRN